MRLFLLSIITLCLLLPATAADQEGVAPSPREEAILSAPLFQEAPGAWLAVSGVGVLGGLALSAWKIGDFASIAAQGVQRPQAQADLAWASLGLVLTASFTICLAELIDQLDPARQADYK